MLHNAPTMTEGEQEGLNLWLPANGLCEAAREQLGAMGIRFSLAKGYPMFYDVVFPVGFSAPRPENGPLPIPAVVLNEAGNKVLSAYYNDGTDGVTIVE